MVRDVRLLRQWWLRSGTYEVLRPIRHVSVAVYYRLMMISVVAYDMRPTPLTDFTNDPRRINEVINPCCGIHPRFARAICSMR